MSSVLVRRIDVSGLVVGLDVVVCPGIMMCACVESEVWGASQGVCVSSPSGCVLGK